MPAATRILLVRLSHLGDVVHALPVFHALRGAFPAAEIAWAVQPAFADLVAGLPGLARTFLFGRGEGLGTWTRLRAELLEWRPDWTIDAQGNTKSGMLTLVSGAPRRSGLARSDWTEAFGAHVLTDSAPKGAGKHALDRMLALAEHVAPGEPARFDLALGADELERGRGLLARRLGPGDGRREWILALPPENDVRSWPAEHFARLARDLAAAGDRVLALSGPCEREVGERLARELSSHEDIRHWVGQRGLRDLGAVFAAAAARGARLVACDSGPAHVAAAAGLPVTLLAGPQDPARTGPWPRPERETSPHRDLGSAHAPDCAPCFARRCTHPAGAVCMSGLTPERVLARLTSSGAVVTGAARVRGSE